MNCPGSTPRTISDCFLASTTRQIPRRVYRGVYGDIQGVWANLAVNLANAVNDRYEVYQCSACGAEVVFAQWQNREGETCRRRIWDSVRGAQK